VAKVTLREITPDNFAECLRLKVADTQKTLVAPNVKSLAEAYVYPGMHPYAIYDASDGQPSESPMVGFTMYEIGNGIGFITRIMIDEEYQRKGYGKAAIAEVIQKLRSEPEVSTIATSHLKHNKSAAQFFDAVGFEEWSPEWASDMPDERILRLIETNAEPAAAQRRAKPRA